MINIQLTGTMSVMLQPLTLLPLSVLSRRRFLATAVLASTGLVLTGGTYDRIPHVSHATLPGRLRGLPRLGTVVECQVFHPSHRHAEQALSAAFAAVDQVDHDMSLYRSQSDIGCINRYGVQQALPIQASTFSVIQDALRIAHMSKGALDITITPLLTQWGFFSQHHQAPSPQHLKQALSLVNYQEVHLDTTRRTVRLGQLGMQLDLGSLGKGYAVDYAIDTLQQQDVRHGMVNAGGDLRLLGTHPDGHPWVVGVQHPLLPAQVLLALSLDAGSVATSGNYVRYRSTTVASTVIYCTHSMDIRPPRRSAPP